MSEPEIPEHLRATFTHISYPHYPALPGYDGDPGGGKRAVSTNVYWGQGEVCVMIYVPRPAGPQTHLVWMAAADAALLADQLGDAARRAAVERANDVGSHPDLWEYQ